MHNTDRSTPDVNDRFDRILQCGELVRLRCRRRWILSICYRDSDNRVDGETLHPTVRSESWWLDFLRAYGAVNTWRQYLIVRTDDD